jgi:hypothetical protein
MTFKKLRLFSTALLAICSLGAFAQDKIYLMDGSTVPAKVKEVGPRNIVYARWDNKDGAEYVVAHRDVERIVFENGTEEIITRGRSRERMDPREERTTSRGRTSVPGYGSNILAIAPLQMTNESPAGVGIHYEHVLDKAGVFSLYLPLAISFFDDEVTQYPTYVNQKKSRVFTTLYPGLKIYPAGSAHRVSYSVGPSFGLGFGTKYKLNQRVDPVTGSIIQTYNDESVFKAGFLINNGLNIQPTKAFYVGLELGIGIFYYNNEYDNFGAGDEPMVQFNFKMGYRF